MLARSAEGLYWLGRHTERTEDLCRLVREQMGALVDRPVREINFGWRRIYGVLHRRPPGPAVGVAENEDDYALADSYTLADDVTFERTNPGSILNSFSNGRENARQMRHCISAEMWTCLNLAWLRLGTQRIEDIWKAAPEGFYAELACEMNLFASVVDTTLYRDAGWRFLQLGRLLRACAIHRRVAAGAYRRRTSLRGNHRQPMVGPAARLSGLRHLQAPLRDRDTAGTGAGSARRRSQAASIVVPVRRRGVRDARRLRARSRSLGSSPAPSRRPRIGRSHTVAGTAEPG